jgi:transcriptional regulator with XRE-family HTH domain
MTQGDLARASRVSLGTIQSFEGGQRQPTAANLFSLRHALEAAGVVFIPSNGEGPGVRLRKPSENDAI